MALLCSIQPAAYAISPHGVDNAFEPDWDDSSESYAEAYDWDLDNILAREWTVEKNGESVVYERQTGWQKDFFQNNVLTTKLYLGISSYDGSSGGSGGNIVAVALGELGKEDSLEIPPNSNQCKYNDWFWGEGTSADWCAAFVCWCADQCGYLNDIIPKSASCSTMFRMLTGSYGYTYYPVTSTTPFGGSSYTPVPGDLMFFSKSGNLGDAKPFEHIGIIVEVEEDGWYTVEGNTTGGGQIPGEGVAKNHFTATTLQARVRNGYIVHVEYPEAVNNDENFALTYNFLVGVMGLNQAAACGVMANMNAESTGIVPDQEELSGGGGYGICQWTGSRRTDLVTWCNANGYDYKSLEGQLWFFRYEIAQLTPSLLRTLKGIENTAQGAYDAAAAFCLQYEIPENADRAAVVRGQSAKNDFWPVYKDLDLAT